MRNSTSSPGWKAAGRTFRLMAMEGGRSSDCQGGDGLESELPAVSSLLVRSLIIRSGCAVTSLGAWVGRTGFVGDIMALLDSWLVWIAPWIVLIGDIKKQETTLRAPKGHCGRIAPSRTWAVMRQGQEYPHDSMVCSRARCSRLMLTATDMLYLTAYKMFKARRANSKRILSLRPAPRKSSPQSPPLRLAKPKLLRHFDIDSKPP